MASNPKFVLITGCSNGGIGSGLAKAFQNRGHHVFAGVRSPSKASDLASLPNVTILTLDVTSKDSIHTAVKAVQEHVGDKGLDILVNNAGFGQPSPMVDADLDIGRQMFEVNFWGLLAAVQAFTPLLVLAKGTIVNISSVGSFIHTPYIGLYSSTKAAVTTASDTLRVELAPLGVKVVTVMTGMVRTEFFDKLQEVKLAVDSYYKRVEHVVNKTPGQHGAMDSTKMDLNEFSHRVVTDVLAGKTGRIYRGGHSSVSWWVKLLLPNWILVSCFSNWSKHYGSLISI
jgi:1-acylglycerone phosphate reductase